MSRLSQIQRGLGQALRSSLPVAEDAASRSFAEAEVRKGAVGPGPAHLEIYREQFGLRHVGSLLEDFPAVRAILGTEATKKLFADYLVRHPPAHYSLLYAGHAFSTFLAASSEGSARAFLSDLAAFEYALVSITECADAPPLSMDAVAAVPEDAWPRLGLALHPAFRLMAFAFPVHEVRRSVDLGQQVHADHSEPEGAHTYVAICRDPRGTPTYLGLQRPQYEALEALVAGKPLGAITDEQLPAWFQEWIAWGWVVGVADLANFGADGTGEKPHKPAP